MKNKLHIAFVVGGFPKISETFIMDQITGMLDRGHVVDIYASKIIKGLKHKDFVRYDLINRTSIYSISSKKVKITILLKFLLLNAIIKHPFIFWYLLINLRKIQKSIYFIELLKKQNRKNYYDIIHCHFGTIGSHFTPLTKYLQSKFIVSFYGFDMFTKRQKTNSEFCSLFKSADKVIANSHYTMDRLLELGCREEKMVIISPGHKIDIFPLISQTNVPRDIVTIITVARLVPIKGLGYAIKAIAKLNEKYAIHYNIVGEGPERPNLEILIEQLNMKSNIHLLGSCIREKVIELMKQSNIALLPSVTDANGRQESGGGFAREAQAMGLPIVASRSGGIPEGVKDGISGFLVPEKDSYAICEKIEFLINHPLQWRQMGKAGRKFIKDKFEISISTAKLENLYYSLLGA